MAIGTWPCHPGPATGSADDREESPDHPARDERVGLPSAGEASNPARRRAARPIQDGGGRLGGSAGRPPRQRVCAFGSTGAVPP